MITALTRYGAIIPRAFLDRKSAIAWADQNAERYGCTRIVKITGSGQRTIWKPAQEVVA